MPSRTPYRPLLRSRPSSALLHHHHSTRRNSTFYHLFPKTLPEGPPPRGPFTLTPSHLRNLRQEFLARQQSVHPDLTTDPAQKTRAEATSAHLNKAYSTLLDPLTRAQHLLLARGIDVTDDEKLQVQDPDLLRNVVLAREEVEEISSEAEWERANVENERRMRGVVAVIEKAFAEDDLEAAKEAVIALLYWRRVKGSLEVWRDRVDSKGWGRGGGVRT